ncbi:hypothetical protein CMU93_11405 [Elizabethkingia anophelis]|nr:hypothetical protein [Elizabethkingia anophelis]
MKKWSKDDAIEVINKQINQLDLVRQQGRKSREHIRWLANILRIIEEIFGTKSRYYMTLANFSWKENGNQIIHGWDFEDQIENNHRKAFLDQINQAEGLLLAALDHLEISDINEVYEKNVSGKEAGELLTLINISEKKLRKLIRQKPEKEKEVQDKYEDLLISSDIEYNREYPHITYSSKQYVPDFTFEKLDLAVEIKLCKSDEKLLIAQLNDDILAYKTKFKNLIFIIYDNGNIRDIDAFKNSFELHDNVIIQVIKH